MHEGWGSSQLCLRTGSLRGPGDRAATPALQCCGLSSMVLLTHLQHQGQSASPKASPLHPGRGAFIHGCPTRLIPPNSGSRPAPFPSQGSPSLPCPWLSQVCPQLPTTSQSRPLGWSTGQSLRSPACTGAAPRPAALPWLHTSRAAILSPGRPQPALRGRRSGTGQQRTVGQASCHF